MSAVAAKGKDEEHYKNISYDQYVGLIEKYQKLLRSQLSEKKKAQKRGRTKTPRCLFCNAAIGMDFSIDADTGRFHIKCGEPGATAGDTCGQEFELEPPTIITPLMDAEHLRNTTNEIVRRLQFLQKRAIVEGGEVAGEDEAEWAELVEELRNLTKILERYDEVISAVRDEDGQTEARRQIQQEIQRMIQKRSEANKDELKRRDYVRQLIASKNRIRELMTVMPVRREVSYELFQVFENGEPSGEAIPAQELLNIDTVGLSHVILKQGGVYGDLVKDIE